jgi:hypothetical protein
MNPGGAICQLLVAVGSGQRKAQHRAPHTGHASLA